jgi:hypothetical protein
MNAKGIKQAMARKAYRKRRLRAKLKSWNSAPCDPPDVRPSLTGWQPLFRLDPANREAMETAKNIDALMKAGLTFPVTKTTHFANDKWWVILNEGSADAPGLHIMVKPNDETSEPTWAELQAIKNQVVGAEQEMVQLCPAESRMVNAATVYHLWGVKDFPMPLGFDLRKVRDRLATAAARFAQDTQDHT